MNKQETDNLILFLEDVQRRPLAWIGVGVPPVVNFLDGFRMAMFALGINIDSLRESVARERGWYNSCQHPYGKMVEQGLNPEQLTYELISMEIAALKQYLANLESDENNP